MSIINNSALDNKKSSSVIKIWSFSFIIWFICDVNFTHSIIAQLMMIIFMGVSAMYIYRFNVDIKPNSTLTIYLLFILIAVYNAWGGYSINPSNSIFFIKSMIKNFIFAMAFHYYWKYVGTHNAIKAIIDASVCATMLLMIITVIKTQSIIIRGDNSLINANILALCAAFSACLIVGTSKTISKKQIMYIGWLILFCILAGTKKALFGCIIGIVLIVFIKKPSRVLRNVLISLLILFAIYIAIYNIPLLYNSIGVRIDDFLYILETGKRDNRSTSIRFELIEDCIRAYKNGHSYFFGNGVNCYYLISSRGLYSHCNYTELLYSLGIIGITVYYFIYFDILKNSIRNALVRKDVYSAIPIALIVFIIFSDIGLVSYFERMSLLLLLLISKELGDYGFEFSEKNNQESV